MFLHSAPSCGVAPVKVSVPALNSLRPAGQSTVGSVSGSPGSPTVTHISHFTGPCLARSIRAFSRKSRGILGVGEFFLTVLWNETPFHQGRLVVLVDELEGMDAEEGAVGV